MKVKVRAYSLCLVFTLLIVGVGAVSASPLPQVLISTLQKREQSLAHDTFNWQVDYKEIEAGEPAQEIAKQQRAVAEQVPAQLRQRGITNDNIIRQQVQSLVQHLAGEVNTVTYTSSTNWQIAQNGNETLVAGARELLASPNHGSSEYYHQYYNKDAAIVINDKREIDGSETKSDDAYAWTSFGDSIRYRNLYEGGLGLIPEHFVVLTGLNPLTIYGAHWHLVSETAEYWKLATDVSQRSYPQFHIEVTLSRSHGGASSRIQVTGGKEILSFDTQSYRLSNGVWLCDKVKFSDNFPGDTKEQLWSLHDVGSTNTINLAYKKSGFVHDYRLLGPELDVHVLPVLHSQQQDHLIIYRWPGYLPSIDELKVMQAKQHPGESTPDPKEASSLPFVGGLMMLVGGVWMFRRRGGSS